MQTYHPALLAALVAILAGNAAWAADTGGAVRQGLFRGRAVVFATPQGRPTLEGDILLDHVSALPAMPATIAPRAAGTAYAQYLWPANAQGVAEIPYVIAGGADQLNAALTKFNSTFSGVIQFVPRAAQADYVSFAFDSGNLSGQCESNVGHVGGAQTVSGSGYCNLGTLLHEMGHTVGLYHEQSRPDRNSYISVDFSNVIKGSEANFNQLSDNFQDLGLFDYASVMEYIPYAFTRNGGPVIETKPAGMKLSNLTGYSEADVDGIKRLYGHAPTQVTIASNPPGLSVIVDGTAVTAPAVFNWTLKSHHTLAVAPGAQALPTGAYVYGRWNDQAAASHAITIAPGNNTLAQPRTAPATTVYTANFIQLSAVTISATPPGAGGVSIVPQPQAYAGVSGTYLVARQQVMLTPNPTGAYRFVTWGGTSAPFSASPKPDRVPDGGNPYPVTAYFSTQPITTITTNPDGFYFKVDGGYYKSPQSFTADVFSGWQTGSNHLLTGFSPSQPYSVNTRFVFNGWSDGGALSHNFTVPGADSTIAGSFTAQYVPIAYAEPGCSATVTLSPASADGFVTSFTPVKISAAAAKGWKLTGWTGDLSGKAASQTLMVVDEVLADAHYNVSTTPFAVQTLSPARLAQGSAGGTVKIQGSGFSATNAVFVNNVYRASTFVNPKEIDVTLGAPDLSAAGAFPIGVSAFPKGAACGAYAAQGFFVSQ